MNNYEALGVLGALTILGALDDILIEVYRLLGEMSIILDEPRTLQLPTAQPGWYQ
jgi:hypothetical protein